MREKHSANIAQWSTGGITPACAGKTPTRSRYQAIQQGSPPRVREKLCLSMTSHFQPRITPACAGKTLKDPIEIANPD